MNNTNTHSSHEHPSSGDRLAALRALVEGQSLENIHGLTKESADMIYALAVARFQADRFDEAQACLRFLCAYCPNEPDFWVALARVARKRGNLQQAISAYFVAFVIEPTPSVCLEMASVYQAQGENERANECIHSAHRLQGEKT